MGNQDSDTNEADHRITVSGASLNSNLVYQLQSELDKYILRSVEYQAFNPKTYNKPTVDEVEMVIQEGQDGTIGL
ncbi:hypothetical protein PGT21_014956 [Puccinia graminis f. sp. tritici]|uniref:Uncharacterized protein n=1 Tax=Puccinia graminis f. sp. tritici TaxID=56615 RepID=A0A5B0NLF5_PUCGR|nr:hypothetical protein PGT21_014956 [Puccinia graminis f. sp. tritici]